MEIIKRSLPLGLIVAVASAFSPMSVHSETLSARGPIPFAAFDLDGSGYITEDEFEAVRANRMAANAADTRPMRGAASAPSFARLDSDGDGLVSPDELATGQAAQKEKRRQMGMGKGIY